MQAACQDVVGFFVLPHTVSLIYSPFLSHKKSSVEGRGDVCVGLGILCGSRSSVPGGAGAAEDTRSCRDMKSGEGAGCLWAFFGDLTKSSGEEPKK